MKKENKLKMKSAQGGDGRTFSGIFVTSHRDSRCLRNCSFFGIDWPRLCPRETRNDSAPSFAVCQESNVGQDTPESQRHQGIQQTPEVKGDEETRLFERKGSLADSSKSLRVGRTNLSHQRCWSKIRVAVNNNMTTKTDWRVREFWICSVLWLWSVLCLCQWRARGQWAGHAFWYR